MAPDPFKAGLSTFDVAREIEAQSEGVYAAAENVPVPFADPGKGLAEALIEATACDFSAPVIGPLFERRI